MKKVMTLSCVLFLFIGLALAGCSGSADQASNQDGEVTLSFWNRFPEVRDQLKDLIKVFEDENPKINIEMQYTPASTYSQQYKTAISNDELPDLFTTGGASLEKLVKLDKVHKLGEVFSKDFLKELEPGVWVEGKSTLNQNKYVFPLYSVNHSGIVLFYNKDVLEKLGFDKGDVPKSWEELIDIGKKIYEKSDGKVYGLIESKEDWVYGGIIRAMSRAITPEVVNAINYKTGLPSYDHKGYVETIKYLKELLDEKVMAPRSLEVSKDQADALFADGQSAFYIQGPSKSSVFVKQYDFKDWGIAKVPTKEGKDTYRITAESVNGIMANNNTKHWKEVKTFLKYLSIMFIRKLLSKQELTQPKKMRIRLGNRSLNFPKC